MRKSPKRQYQNSLLLCCTDVEKSDEAPSGAATRERLPTVDASPKIQAQIQSSITAGWRLCSPLIVPKAERLGAELLIASIQQLNTSSPTLEADQPRICVKLSTHAEKAIANANDEVTPR